jgi:hypothetical protein
MSDAERADITNGIWLCRICHKMVDADADRYTSDLLLNWRRIHDSQMAQQLGKPGELIRLRTMEKTAGFGDLSALAQQILIDKPDFWEYKVTAEILRYKLESIVWRASALRDGLYSKPFVPVPTSQAFDWMSLRLGELVSQASAFERLVNQKMKAAWGEPGVAGSQTEIIRVCSLLAECGEQIVGWEERVQFSKLHDAFNECKNLLAGNGAILLDTIAKIPSEISKIFAVESPHGAHKISLVPDLPDGWSDQYELALKKAAAAISKEH